MPKRIPKEELDAIAAVVAAHPGGVRVEGIRRGLDTELPARMLQRRLKLLEDQGRIASEGTGKGKRYLPRPLGIPAGVKAEDVAEPAPEIGLSPAALELRRIISSPLSHRTPVGYEHGFLDAYRPNESFYLPEHTRIDLARIGKPEDDRLPAGTHLKQIYHRLLIDLSFHSSRLEGNTYSLLDTKRLLELGQEAEGKDTKDAQMILNHKAAIELLVDPSPEIGFNRYTICNLHALLSENLLADPGACGLIRSKHVGIDGSVFEPLNVPQGLEERFDLFLGKCGVIDDPIEQAFFALVHLPYLQPFEDVNKRVSRLAANLPLIRRGFCPLSYVDMPSEDYTQAILCIYELTRVEYLRDVFIWAYKRSAQRYSAVRQSLGEPDPFRMKYRSQIAELVAGIIRKRAGRRAVSEQIEHFAAGLPARDRARMTEIVETELIHLHEGNIARYQLRPSEFEEWRKIWNEGA